MSDNTAPQGIDPEGSQPAAEEDKLQGLTADNDSITLDDSLLDLPASILLGGAHG